MTYIISIKTAILVFPIALIIFLIPFLIWQYRKYGAISPWRFIVTFAFVFYLISAYFLIILPLPSKEEVAHLAAEHYPKYNLDPLMIIKEFVRSNPMVTQGVYAWKEGIKDGTFIQPLFNLALTIPFGFFLHYYFQVKLKTTLIASFCLSLFFELTQLSALYGLYQRPYRLFDVDDLILNTLGGIIGYAIAPIFQKLLPDLSQVNEKSAERSDNISLGRRILAFFIDLVITALLASLFQFLFKNFLSFSMKNILILILIFVVMPCLLGGSTLGMKVVKLQYGSILRTGKAAWWQIVLRNFIGYGIIICNIYFLNWLLFQLSRAKTSELSDYIALILIILLPLIFFIGDILLLLKKGHRTWYEKLSRTKQISLFNSQNFNSSV